MIQTKWKRSPNQLILEIDVLGPRITEKRPSQFFAAQPPIIQKILLKDHPDSCYIGEFTRQVAGGAYHHFPTGENIRSRCRADEYTSRYRDDFWSLSKLGYIAGEWLIIDFGPPGTTDQRYGWIVDPIPLEPAYADTLRLLQHCAAEQAARRFAPLTDYTAPESFRCVGPFNLANPVTYADWCYWSRRLVDSHNDQTGEQAVNVVEGLELLPPLDQILATKQVPLHIAPGVAHLFRGARFLHEVAGA